MTRSIALALLASAALLSQEAAAPKKSAGAWVPLVDAGKYAESWDKASDSFQKGVTKDQWIGAVKQARAPLGKFKSRTLSSSQPLKNPPNAPPGDYYIIQYDSDFEFKNGAIETVIVVEQKGKGWRVAGYFIK